MASEFEFITKEFSSTLEKGLLEQIFKLNQENIPEVGDLNSAGYRIGSVGVTTAALAVGRFVPASPFATTDKVAV